jgi:N-acetylmuramate 1-kinase
VNFMFEQDLLLAGEAASMALGERLSLWVRPGMLVLLEGDLGSGKSTLARAFIRALMKPGEVQDIPSPTFSLIQSYDCTRVPVFHADLYRLKDAAEVEELGLEGLLSTLAGLVEWPDRMEGVFPRADAVPVLKVALTGRGASRTAHLKATGDWARALERDRLLTLFLETTPHANSTRYFFEGDASSRRYEKLVAVSGESCLLMDMPQRPDGPVVKYGKPYSQIAHLAENITAVVAINHHLLLLGYSAPRVPAFDLATGFGLIEPLGDKVYGRMLLAGEDMLEPLETAAAVLADMVDKPWPRHPEAAPGITHTLHDYDERAQLIEVDLLPSWFIPHARGVEAGDAQKQEFAAIWSSLLPLARSATPVWNIRDYHSPNLLWIPEREGLKRVGIIDSQDAVMGHPAYDLVSMTQDARVDISAEMEEHILSHYMALRMQNGGFDRDDFLAAYALLGAQRATKILGIFARLNKRDGKPAYLKHMPRVSRYLQRNMAHPALLPLRHWIEKHVPEALEVGR